MGICFMPSFTLCHHHWVLFHAVLHFLLLYFMGICFMPSFTSCHHHIGFYFMPSFTFYHFIKKGFVSCRPSLFVIISYMYFFSLYRVLFHAVLHFLLLYFMVIY